MAQGRIKLGVDIVKGNTSGLEDLKRQFASLNQMVGKLQLEVSTDEALKELQEVQSAIAAVEKALSVSYNVKLDSTNVTKFKDSLAASNMSITKVQSALKKMGTEGQNAFRNLSVELLTSNKNLKQANATLDKMAETLSNTVRWTVASTALNSITGAVQKAWSFTKQLDTSLNDIRIVTGKSADEMARFAKQANTAAKNLGATTKNYTDAALIYYQQGLGEEDVQARASTTLKAANVTGQSSAEVSQQLTAVWNGYKVQAQEAELYIDKLSAVAATTAADLEELSTGMSKVASAASVMGVDIDQLNAQLATIVSVTRQAPESIGTALKTVYARMTDIQAGVDTETTLGEYTSQMAEMGINVLDANGRLREMGDVVEEIGNNWNKLTREQQVSLAQTIAGTRQYNNMMALFDNWNMYQQAKSTSENSAGSLQKQQEIYLDSLDAHLNKLTAEAEELYQTLMDPEGLNPLIDALTTIVGLAENVVEGLGGGKGVVGVVGALGMNVMRGKITSEVARGWQNAVSEKENRKMAEDEQAIANEINVDDIEDERTKKLIELKKSQLKVSRALTAEEIESQNTQIEKTNELYKQQDALAKSKRLIEDIASRQLNRDDLFDGNGLVQLDADYVTHSNEVIDEYNSQKVDLSAISRIGQTYDTIGQKNRLIANAQGSLQRAENDFDAAATDEELIKANQDYEDAMARIVRRKEELIQAEEKHRTALEEQAPLIQQAIENITAMSEDEDYSIALKEELVEIVTELNAVYDENGALREDNAETIARGQAAFERYNELLDKQVEEIRELDKEAREYNATLQQNTEATAQAEKELKKEQERLAKMSTVDIFSNMTTGVMNLGSAIQNLQNLGSIWSNEDLTTGEKLLQTVTNLAFTLPMLISGFKLAKTGLSDLLGKLAQYEAKTKEATHATEKKNETEQEAQKETKETAEASREKSEAQREEARTTNEAADANERKSETEDDLQKETRETASSSDGETPDIDLPDNNKTDDVKKAVDTVDDATDAADGVKKVAKTADTVDDVADGVKTAKKVSKAGKLKTSAKTGLKNWGGKLKGAGKGVAKFAGAHSGAVAAIGGAVVAMAATWAMLDYANNKQKKAMEEASVASDKAADSYNRVSARAQELTSSLDNLTSMQDAMSGLTKGTLEWQMALEQVNSEVLALIDEFPELGEHVTTNADGMMTITKEGRKIVEERQQEEKSASRANSIAAKRNARDAELEYLKDEWADKATWGSETGEFFANAGAIAGAGATGLGVGLAAGTAIGGPLGALIGAAIGATAGTIVGAVSVTAQEAMEENKKKTVTESEDFKKFAEAYSIYGNSMMQSEDALQKALESVGGELNETTKALYDNKQATEDLIKAYNADKAADYAEWIALGESVVGTEASTIEKVMAGKDLSNKVDKDSQAYKDELKAVKDKWGGLNEADINTTKHLADKLGWDYDSITAEGTNKVQVRKDGQVVSEYNMDEIYDMLTYENLRGQTGSSVAEIKAAAKPLEEAFSSDAITNLLAEVAKGEVNFTGLTLGEMEQVTKNALSTSDWAAFASKVGMTGAEAQRIYEAGVAKKDQALAEVEAGLDSRATANFNKLNIDKTSLTLDSYRSFIESYSDIAIAGGQRMLNEYDDILKAAGGKSDDFINALTSTDWSGIADPAEHARTIAENLGLELTPELEAKLGTIVNVLADHVETLDKLQEKYASWQTLIDKTVAGTIWSAEEYDKLEKSQQKYFTTMADGTHVLIGNARKLRDELRKAQAEQGYRDALAAIGVQNKLTNDITEAKGKGEDTTALEFELEQAQAKTLDAFVQYAKTAENEKDLNRIWNDARFKNVQGKTAALKKEVLQTIDIQNLADTLGAPIEEVAALWSKFAGKKGAIVDYYTRLTVATRELENQKRIVQELEDSTKFLGSDTERLENLKEQSKALTEQARLEQELLDIELEGIAKDVQNNNLTAADLKKAGITKTEYDAFINGMVNNGAFDEAFYQKLKEAALRGGVEDFDLLDEYLAQYSDKLIEGTDTVNQSLYAALDKNAESFELQFTLELDVQKTKREFAEFYKNFDSTQGVQVELFNFKSYQEDLSTLSRELNELHQTETAITEEQWEQMSAEEKTDAIAEGRISVSEKERLIKEKTSQIMETITSQQESQMNAIEEMNKLYDEQVSYLETASGLIDKQLKTQELLTGKESKDINLLQQKRDIDKSIYESRKKQFADIKAQYDALDPNDRSADADAIRKAYFEAANGVADAMNSALESNAAYIEEYAKSMMEGVFGLSRSDIEMAQEEQDWIDKDANKYLDNINKAYELDKMRRTFDKAINESTNISAQQRLAKIYNEQVKALEAKGELTKEDFERVNTMLELEQARLDLENARDSKTQMRLMRGANGTYSYQYVADQSKIDEAEQKVADLENELYNMDKDALKESSTYFAEQWMAALDMVAKYAKGGFSEDEKGNLLNVFRVLAKDKKQAEVMMGNWLETNGLTLDKALGFSDEEWADRGFSKKMVSFFKSMAQGDMSEFLKTIEDGTEEELQAFLEGISNLDYTDIIINAQQGATNLNNPLLEGSTALADLGKLAEDNAGYFDNQTTAILRTCAALSGLSALISGEGLDASKLTGDMATFVDTVTKTMAPSSADMAACDTGGYTGAWGPEGKFLLAHEKELILNKYDTANILSAVNIVRSLGDSMLKTVSGMGRGYDLPMAAWELAKDFIIEQTVYINAEFPDATDRSELEAAFEELMLLATQHAFDSTKD